MTISLWWELTLKIPILAGRDSGDTPIHPEHQFCVGRWLGRFLDRLGHRTSGVWDGEDVFCGGTNDMVFDHGVVCCPDSRIGVTGIPDFASDSLSLADSTAQSSANQLGLMGVLEAKSVFIGLLQICIHVCLSHPFLKYMVEVGMQLRINV